MNMISRRVFTKIVASSSVLAMSSQSARSASFPSRPIRLIVGFAPGGSHDIVARILAQHLPERLGQPVLVENKVGAGGTIGATSVVRSAPDGHTLLVGSVSNIVISPVTMKNPPFDPSIAFSPIVAPTTTPLILIVKSDSPIDSVNALLSLARSRPGEITFASAGLGTSNHLGGELLNKMAGIKLSHIPYKGDALGALSVASGETHIMLATLPPAIPLLKAGRIRFIAVASANRIKGFPDLPTVSEAGVPDFEVNVWNGVVAPANTPSPVVNQLRQEIISIMKLPQVMERLSGLGFETIENTPESMLSFIKSDVIKWHGLANSLGIV